MTKQKKKEKEIKKVLTTTKIISTATENVIFTVNNINNKIFKHKFVLIKNGSCKKSRKIK